MMGYSLNRETSRPAMWIGDDGEMQRPKLIKRKPMLREAPEPEPTPSKRVRTGHFKYRVVEAVSDALYLDPETVTGKPRHRKYVEARAVIARILNQRNPTVYSTNVIGALFGGRHHTTIMHLLKSWDVYCRRNPFLEDVLEDVLEVLKQ